MLSVQLDSGKISAWKFQLEDFQLETPDNHPTFISEMTSRVTTSGQSI